MVKRPRDENASRPILAFVGRFAGAWVVALAVLAVVPAVERWAVRATIASLSLFSHFLRIECVPTGSYVRLAGADLEIVGDCTSLMPTLALWSAILAFPAPRFWKAAGMLAGASALWIYNLSRVIAIALVLRSHPTWFEFVHAYLWQTLTLGIVFLMFVAWIRIERMERVAP